MRRAVAYAGVATAILTLLFGLAARVNTLEPGLSAHYGEDQLAGGGPRRTIARLDAPPFSSALANAWPDAPSTPFSVTWAGQLSVLQAGTYTLAVSADAGSSLFIDDRQIFDNVLQPENQFASGQIDLSRGAHAIFISYAARGAAPRLELLWSRDGRALSPVPGWLLRPRRASEVRVRISRFIEAAPVALAWAWAILLVAVGVLIATATGSAAKRLLERSGLWRELRWILAGSLVLIATGFWWGLPAAWVPIELTPTFIVDAVSHHFSHGWYDAYPPLQYYVLSAAISPLLVLQTYAGVNVYGTNGHAIMVAIFRLVSVAMGLGMVACAGLAGLRAFGKRAGLFAAAAFALTTPFLFYSKTGNVDVPYLFWFSVSVVFYLQLVEELRLVDFLGLAAAAACAVCTKDQAYGLYVLIPFVIVGRIWRDNRRKGIARAFARALVDRRILWAAATAAVLFAAFHNLLFNVAGFKAHLAFIAGPGSADYRLYEPTFPGRWMLLKLTLRLIQQSMGWPLFLAAAAGTVTALASGRRLSALCLLVPVVSYYVFFIDVVLYNYDRFVIPVCFVLAVFAGKVFDVWLSRARGMRPFAVGAVAAVFAYTLLYAGTVDVLMLRDSRYDAGRWMAANVRGELIGATEQGELIPDMTNFRMIGLENIEELRRERPRFFVLNTDYGRAAQPGTPWAALINGMEAETLGYRRVSHFRTASPWPWLPGGHPDLVGAREGAVVFSVLRDINPTIDIFERED